MRYSGVMVGLLFVAASSAANASTITGRITYLSQDRHELMLDNNALYAIGSNVDSSKANVADRVKLNFENRGDQKVVTSLTLDPLRPGTES